MPRLQVLFEIMARALSDAAAPGSTSFVPVGDSLLTVAALAHQELTNRFSDAELRDALRNLVAAPDDTVDLAMEDAVAAVAASKPWIKRRGMQSILELMPPIVRQLLRRPGDPTGTSVPQQLQVEKPDDWLIFFPDRLTRFRSDEALEAYDNWKLGDLRGLGPFSEVWHAASNDPHPGEAALKFITEPRAAGDFMEHENHFRRILELDPISGLVPLRSVYLLADPPCLESIFVTGYDLAALIRDWRWCDEAPPPEQTSQIIKRAAKIVGSLHVLNPPVVHRGLKPSNILLHPTAEGKVTVWISDLGWGEISTRIALERTEQAQAKRQSRRGALASLYVSPEQLQGLPPDPRDDIHALGVIWYQLLKRDTTARPPQGYEWAIEFQKQGLSEGHARLLASCIDADPEYRPANGLAFASQIDAHFNKGPDHGSRTFALKAGTEKRAAFKNKSRAAVANLPTPDRPVTTINSLGIPFAFVPAGTFAMGSPEDEKGRRTSEGPVHMVKISRPYYLSVYPITQEQFQRVTGRNPSHFTRTLGGGPTHPVEQVSWDEALEFCNRMMLMPEEQRASRIYRLPTEAEWEYACRAGTTTPFSFGDSVTLTEVHFFGLSAATWAKSSNTAGKTARVDGRPGNAWGLHDMHGNVMEWCHDWWSENYYAESPAVDPQGPDGGTERVVRGGSFSQFSAECRSAARAGRSPATSQHTVGFRVALTLPGM